MMPSCREIAEPGTTTGSGARLHHGLPGQRAAAVLNLALVMDPDGDGTTLLGIPDRDGLPARLTFLTVGLWWAGFAQFAFRVLP